MTRAYVGLGANLGRREETLREAVGILDRAPDVEVVAVSELRETEPVGPIAQPLFLNGALAVETTLSARGLLELLLDVERSLGRIREERWGPRVVDLDLLLYGDDVRRRAGNPGPASAAPRASIRPGAARGVGSRPRASGPGTGLGPARGARLSASMSHLDDLDEFEAELELSLKREYSAVFLLFRYCVLTQDATYLCNKLDLEALPQVSYPFFHVRMEDVWVWDKNRPTQDHPARGGLHLGRRDRRGAARRRRGAAAHRGGARRAHRRSRSRATTNRCSSRKRQRCCSPSTSATRRRCSASSRDAELVDHWRLATERSSTADELGVLLDGLLDLESVDGICLASTVPVLVREWESLAVKWAHAPLLVVGPGSQDRASRFATTTRARSARTGS